MLLKNNNVPIEDIKIYRTRTSQTDLSSVGRAEDCSCLTDILRSLVRIR